jgi:hypothetical protein
MVVQPFTFVFSYCVFAFAFFVLVVSFAANPRKLSRAGSRVHLHIYAANVRICHFSHSPPTGVFFFRTKRTSMAAAAINVPNNRPVQDDVGPNFERLRQQIDNDDPDFNGLVQLEASRTIVLSDDGAQRLGQSLMGATARGRHFDVISICPYYMTADAGQYSALLEFFATGQYLRVFLDQDAEWPAPPPEMLAAMEHVLTAMISNQQPAALTALHIVGMSLTMQTLHLALQCRLLVLIACRMESPLLPLILPRDITDHDNHPAAAAAAQVRSSPERGSGLHLVHGDDSFGILQEATKLKTNVTSLRLSFIGAIVGPVDLSRLIGFVATQPNGMDLTIIFHESSRMNGGVVEHILADILTQCPGVHSLAIHVNDAISLLIRERFPRLKELVSDSSLSRLTIERFGRTVFSREQEQQIAVITQRNSMIPVYLRTTNLLKPRRPLVVNPNDPAIVVYAHEGEDRRKYQFLLSHALSQAAVHPIFFSHVYEFVREHVDELFGPEGLHHHQQ